jgi:hypothetical protein
MYANPSASKSSHLSNLSPLCIRTHILLEPFFGKERKKRWETYSSKEGREEETARDEVAEKSVSGER